MSFVTTRPEALMAAASMLEALGSSMDAQNAAAVAPTTSIAPAAADEVSVLQAAQFSAYGAWYQQVSAQAKAVHQTLVKNLDTNAGTYGETEAANRVATAPSYQQITPNAATPGAAADPPPPGSTTLGTGIGWGQNVGAAASDFITLGEGQFAPVAGAAGIPNFTGGLTSASAPAPAAPAAAGAAPVLASMGRGPSIGALSVPPSWAAGGVPAVNPVPAQLVGAGFTSPAPHAAPMTTVPGGLPSMATSGRGGYGLGAPRYGVKPTVMPKPAI